jgi:protein-S-isoprenylcysteine O-methyltransferase Ste14
MVSLPARHTWLINAWPNSYRPSTLLSQPRPAMEKPKLMFARALIAFLVLPGVVAYAVPWLLAPGRPAERPFNWFGLGLIGAGTILLLLCVRAFYVSGKGTLAPWIPPRELVTVGLYQWSRNPMYLSVLVVLFGWSVMYLSLLLLGYAVCVALAFHLRVLFYEEPRLNGSFGEQWQRYRERVPRWLFPRP